MPGDKLLVSHNMCVVCESATRLVDLFVHCRDPRSRTYWVDWDSRTNIAPHKWWCRIIIMLNVVVVFVPIDQPSSRLLTSGDSSLCIRKHNTHTHTPQMCASTLNMHNNYTKRSRAALLCAPPKGPKRRLYSARCIYCFRPRDAHICIVTHAATQTRSERETNKFIWHFLI